MIEIESVSSLNPKIYSTDKPTYWTNAKVKQLALFLFSVVLAGGAIATALLVAPPVAFCAIPLGAASLLVGYLSFRMKVYNDPVKLKFYKDQAPISTFEELYSQHGIKNILKYQLLTLDQLKEKFNIQIQEMNFSSVAKGYNLDELLVCHVMTEEHVTFLRNLIQQEKVHRAEYEAHKRLIDLRAQQARLIVDKTEECKERVSFNQKMNALEAEYTQYKQQLVSF